MKKKKEGMKYLVVDTWVWRKVEEADPHAVKLITEIIIKCHKIIIDYEGEIQKEYERRLKNGSIIWKFFKYLSGNKKIVHRPKHDITINYIYLSDDDKKFIQIAKSMNPPAPIISGDSDFLKLRECIRNGNLNLDIEIFTPDEALNEL
jgi:predicted nucleic acid-binding protein